MIIENLLRAKWWKILGAVIMLYVLIAGLLVPLKPGITSTSILNVDAGKSVKFQIEGYNTKFAEADNRVWLKIDSTHLIEIESNKIASINNNLLEVGVHLPDGIPSKDKSVPVTLITNNSAHGTAIFPSAFYIRSNGNMDASGWNGKIDHIHKLDGFKFPFRNILEETIRNTFFHVAIWMAMFVILIISLVYSVKYLMRKNLKHDIYASSLIYTAVLLGTLGMITGSIWARMTWGTWWTNDIKLNMATIAMLIYLSYVILRSSINDIDRRAQISAGYAIFAFVAMIPLVFVLPRMTDSLHPGNGGNPALGGEDLDHTLRMVFYPAGIGLTLLGLWIASILVRMELIKEKIAEHI